MNKVFVDSNILLYLIDTDAHKKNRAADILTLKPCISAQVLTEVANVCKRKFSYSKNELLNLWLDLLSDCDFVSTDHLTFHNAIALVKRYNFQLFDALIVASALNTNCSILYSEDMQHQMRIENRLTIINPFL